MDDIPYYLCPLIRSKANYFRVMDPSNGNILQHLLILCCYGGVPFLNYEISTSPTSAADYPSGPLLHAFHPMDPTDWIAMDESGQLLNATLHPSILAEQPQLASLLPTSEELSAAGERRELSERFDLEQCDLYNLTFSSQADEHIFRAARGRLECR